MAAFALPKALSDVFAKIDAERAPIEELTVSSSIEAALKNLSECSDADRAGGRAEHIAFNLTGENDRQSEWGTHFGPLYTVVDEGGQQRHFPNLGDITPDTIAYWSDRALIVSHPVLAARYADAAWDLARPADVKLNVLNARIASDAYLASASSQYREGLYDFISAAIRSLNLAVQIRDAERTGAARATLMELHRLSLEPGAGCWWMVPRRLLRNDRNGCTDDQTGELVSSLEDLIKGFGDFGDGKRFDPHSLKDAADILTKYYYSKHEGDNIPRLQEAVARSFEAAAGIAEPMVGSSFLQEAVNAFRAAGMREESDRVRVSMQDAIRDSHASLKAIVSEIRIPFDDVDKFVAGVVVDDPPLTLALLAKAFLASRSSLEMQLQEQAKKAPLQFLIPMQIMQDNFVSATIGSLQDDPVGRLIYHTDQYFALNELWLMNALDRAIEKHEFTADHFTGWSNRHGLFDDMTFVHDGFSAWFDGNYVEALHLLIPQVETAFRSIAASLGRPTTKAHPSTANASIPVNLGDMLSDDAIAKEIGPDIGLHFRALYSDPRGANLRNRIAHGMFASAGVGPHVLRNIVHSFLVLGLWKELAAPKKKR